MHWRYRSFALSHQYGVVSQYPDITDDVLKSSSIDKYKIWVNAKHPRNVVNITQWSIDQTCCCWGSNIHYNGVIMGAIASQITCLTIVYSTVYSDAGQRKHQSSASLAFVQGIHRGPVNSPHKWPVTRKIFPFDDVIMSTKTRPVPLLLMCWLSTSSAALIFYEMLLPWSEAQLQRLHHWSFGIDKYSQVPL